jgi:hypothetical protein
LYVNRLDNAAQELAIAATRGAFEAAYPATRGAFEAEYPTTLIENSHPDYQAILPSEELLRYIENTKRSLGSLTALIAIRGSTNIPRIPYGQTASSAKFEIDLDFQNSPASVTIEMVTVDGRWLITAFGLSANLLND